MKQVLLPLCLPIAALLCCVGALAQVNEGELRLRVTNETGVGVRSSVSIVSQAAQYHNLLATDDQGRLTVQRLPFGPYRLRVQRPGFAETQQEIDIRSAIPFNDVVKLQVANVEETVTVSASGTLIDTGQPGSVSQIGTSEIEDRQGSIPGRSIQDLVNSQPGWLYEGNAVLHPRGSEYQVQFVVDGVPLTDNRSPSFGPAIEADDAESLHIYTAGFPAEYGRKMGGVVEVNTLRDTQPGFHGKVALSGGSFESAGGFAEGQYVRGRNTLGGSVNGSRTEHYLNPVVPQNFSNTGTISDFSLNFRRDLTTFDHLMLSVRHELSSYDIPNEQVQQAAGQRQTAGNLETIGVASWQHIFSANALLDLRSMIRDNANGFNSNPESTPVEIFQQNSFREGYFKGSATIDRGRHEWKIGVESDATFLHERLRYEITDPSRYDEGTPLTFAFSGQRPDIEQSVFVQDIVHFDKWTINAGLRWDHYQLLLNRNGLQPRFAISRYLSSIGTVLHFSYDRVFQTPSSENILLSSSTAVQSISNNFLRLPVEPSKGDYFEGGLTTSLRHKVRLDANYFRRVVSNFADDDQIDNTSISFPISFRKAIIYGAEAKVAMPEWRRFSGFASYSYEVGNAWNPVTGGLFLGDNASAAASDLSGHFPVSQDQRNTVRSRLRYQATPRFWLVFGTQYDTGLPFEFDGDPGTVAQQYGAAVLDRINFDRGRIRPAFQVSASAGAELLKTDLLAMHLQADGENLNDVLDVIDFGGLFSGNAIGPPRSITLRLTTTF